MLEVSFSAPPEATVVAPAVEPRAPLEEMTTVPAEIVVAPA